TWRKVCTPGSSFELSIQPPSLQQRKLLRKCATTALSSTLICQQKAFFAKMVKGQSGAVLEDSQLVAGIAFKKMFSYTGFEMYMTIPNVERQLKAEKDNAEIRVHTGEVYQEIVDVQWNILQDKLGKTHHSGAKVLVHTPHWICGTQYFAGRNILCALSTRGRSERTIMTCGGSIQAHVNALSADLGHSQVFEDTQLEGKGTIFSLAVKICTFLLCGAEQFMEEMAWSLHDTIMMVRRSIKNDPVGGATDMELSKYLQVYSRTTILGKQQLLIGAYAKALEIIPRQLCDNAGFDATNILNKLCTQHTQYGVDINNKDTADNKAFGWEPALVWINGLTAASEAVCLIVSVDETIKKPHLTVDTHPAAGQGLGHDHPF
uniref:Uncharacterized protein n=1 Tax=Otolemur garnettii TaxID=30611 RepID=H0Y2C4_OTOGA